MPHSRYRRYCLWLLICACVITTTIASAGAAAPLRVEAKRKPADPEWKPYDTRTVGQLAGFNRQGPKIELCKYGGWASRKSRTTGFFHVEKLFDRWWLIDPDGCLFIHVGVCSVRAEGSPAVREALAQKYGSLDKWAEAVVALLRDNGFNGTGGWSDAATLRKTARPMPYALSWNFMGSFGRSKKLTSQMPGHLGYAGDCIPVFHPEFEAFCDTYAAPLAATKDDPYLIGHFSDNELPASRDLLDKFLALDVAHPDLAPNRRAAEQWLAQRRGAGATGKDITDEDRRAFLGYVYD
ncbi:MAG: hypothetical protein N3D11_09630, partial [Candidatus Sumerlaeia bacterium]|nr:hypothetical protein [Candidatus Sumerlaeia bacterium]